MGPCRATRLQGWNHRPQGLFVAIFAELSRVAEIALAVEDLRSMTRDETSGKSRTPRGIGAAPKRFPEMGCRWPVKQETGGRTDTPSAACYVRLGKGVAPWYDIHPKLQHSGWRAAIYRCRRYSFASAAR